ncbi:hypothetical protein [Candidatus Chloroploca sp. Khr17]|uniref:hypothetical protein n=1 Tax=Candidatus Chloroploca sp. Khr17 TaxID=2496869 RepID=UPI0013EC4E66|nr:hypothetical protein [Candidatus Chloroploca sp. Khr17]
MVTYDGGLVPNVALWHWDLFGLSGLPSYRSIHAAAVHRLRIGRAAPGQAVRWTC